MSARIFVGALVACLLALGALGSASGSHTPEWPGVDDAVIGRFVTEAGRPAPRALLELRGDALLFAFLCAGLAAGFFLGFWGRALFVEGVAREARRGDRDA